jgi:hypothetical protein
LVIFLYPFLNHTTLESKTAFERIKEIVVSRECLTVIDHINPGNNKIFLTCDASDWGTGAMLSWGESWETARPVAYNSSPLKGAKLNYPVHEKELLAVIQAVKKWWSDLLGSHFFIYMDHRTLLNFEGQKDLSRRQARWMETLSQFEMTFVYIRGEDNTVADGLSQRPHLNEPINTRHDIWQNPGGINAVLTLEADKSLLDEICEGYKKDEYCVKLSKVEKGFNRLRTLNGL